MKQFNVSGKFFYSVGLTLALIASVAGCDSGGDPMAPVMTSTEETTITTNGRTARVLLKFATEAIRNPNLKPSQVAAFNAKGPKTAKDFKVEVKGPGSSQYVSAVRAAATTPLAPKQVGVLPVADSHLRKVSLISGNEYADLIVPADFYFSFPTEPGRYEVVISSKEGFAPVVPAKFIVNIAQSGKAPSVFSSNTLNVANIDTARASRKAALAGTRQVSSGILLSSSNGALVGSMRSSAAASSGGVQDGQFNANVAKGFTMMAGQTNLAPPSALQGDGNVQSAAITGGSAMQANFSMALAEAAELVGGDPARTLFVFPQGWYVNGVANQAAGAARASNATMPGETGASSIILGTKEVLTPDDPNSNDPGIHDLLGSLRPALAVSGGACIFCHADVRGNTVINFGAERSGKRSYFFGLDSAPGTPFSLAMYGDHAENYATAKFSSMSAAGVRQQGTVIVPNVSASEVGHDTIASYLRGVLSSPGDGLPAPVVKPKAWVTIGAPTKADLDAAFGAMPAAHPKWKFLSPVGADITGLQMAPGNAYVRNTPGGTLDCSGGLYVTEVLFLNDLRVRTDEKGCRIYGAKSIFVQGPITYVGGAAGSNIQIVSAVSVMLGLGQDTLANRFSSYGYSFHTKEAGLTTAEKNDRILQQAALIPDLTDAASRPEGREVPFEHILVNAPMVMSRYLGSVKGVVITEAPMFALGAFIYTFDDVFNENNHYILPELNVNVIANILSIGEDSDIPPPPGTPTPTPTATASPTAQPTIDPEPSGTPIVEPTVQPDATEEPTQEPTAQPTVQPTVDLLQPTFTATEAQ